MLFAIHPGIVEDSVNGMETAVAVFTIALTSWLFILIATDNGPCTMRAYILLGVAAGLMLLARTDTAFILAPLLLYLLVRERSTSRVTRPVAAGGTALLMVAPWAIWSLVTFGTVIQVSGVAVPDIERQAFLAEHGDALGTQIERSWEVTRTAFYDDVPRWYLTPAGLKPALLLTGVVVIACMLLLPFRERARPRRHVGLFAVTVSGMDLMLLFHAGVRWHVREWYYAPVGFYMAVLLGIGVSYVDGVVRGHRPWWSRERDDDGSLVSLAPERRLVVSWRAWVLAATVAILVSVLIGVYGPSQEGRWVVELPHRENMLEGALWMRDNLDEDARIGSFNAGILGYFSERAVVNLDGVVNVDAYEARRDGRTVEYMCDQRLRYLVDLGMAQFASGPACGEPAPSRFELVTTIGDELTYFGGGQVDVLEVSPINGGESESIDVRP